MIGRITAVVLIIFSAGILFTSVLRAASMEFEFTGAFDSASETPAQRVFVSYDLPEAHVEVKPDGFFWPLNALIERTIIKTSSDITKSEKMIEASDTRLVAAQMFFEQQNIESSVGMLMRAEKYLENAHEHTRSLSTLPDEDIAQSFQKIANAALKHRQVIEMMVSSAPEDARPTLVKTLDISKRVYDESVQEIRKRGGTAPQNPFEGAR